MSRRICVVTGTRADYGLLRWIMRDVQAAPDLELQVIATGMHLSPEFGLTYREIEADGFRINRRVEMLLSADTPMAVAKSIGLGVIGCSDALAELAPDVVLVLGDRFEILAAVIAALPLRLPVAHLHGGEVTEGAIDEAMRHAVTKLSHLHFVAAAEYRNRVVQLGERPEHVYVVGGLGVDSAQRTPLLDRTQVEAALGVGLGNRSLLVTFHPATLERASAESQMAELLAALGTLEDTTLIFTFPNADTDGRALFDRIREFVATRPRARAFTSLGHTLYLSCLRCVDGVVGNSSSGLLEAPSFHKGTVNVGDRQRGRLRAESVIDCAPDRVAIGASIQLMFSDNFRARLPRVRNPYGDGGASERVVDTLRHVDLTNIVRKSFFDVPVLRAGGVA